MNTKFSIAENNWKNQVNSSTSREHSFRTASGEEVDLLYYPRNADNDYLNNINFPGQFPYTRGIHSNLYRGKLWTMRQYSGFASAKESNKRFRYLLKQGVTGLSVAFDLPTQTGYDSDHELSIGEVGKVGVPISTLEDMEILLKDIPLDKVYLNDN